jgi:hypothetical protein
MTSVIRNRLFALTPVAQGVRKVLELGMTLIVIFVANTQKTKFMDLTGCFTAISVHAKPRTGNLVVRITLGSTSIGAMA